MGFFKKYDGYPSKLRKPWEAESITDTKKKKTKKETGINIEQKDIESSAGKKYTQINTDNRDISSKGEYKKIKITKEKKDKKENSEIKIGEKTANKEKKDDKKFRPLNFDFESTSDPGKEKKSFQTKLKWPSFKIPLDTLKPEFSGSTPKIINGPKFRVKISRRAALGAAGGFAAAMLIIFIITLAGDFIKVKALADFQPNVTTNIYDTNGLLVSELFRQKREVVPLSAMPKDIINAFIAIEDNEFYDHFGINIKGIIRAFFVNLFSGQIKQGGSTITQQLAKILLTTRERNIFRKIKEAFISLMIELIYSKDKIMELYLNQIFLGHGVYGVESAAKFYFNKQVKDLNPAECALLATLPSAPNKLSPIRHTKRSIERHRVVLAKMVESGFITIPQAEECYLAFWPDYLVYLNELPPTATSWSRKIDRAPWFTEYVRRKLIAKYGEDAVYMEGLTVQTTLDLTMQTAAQRIMEDALEKQTVVSSSLSFKNEDYIIENFNDVVEAFSLLYGFDPQYKKGSLENKKINDLLQKDVLDELEGLNYLIGLDNIDMLLDEYKVKFVDYKNYQKVEGCLVTINHQTGGIEALVGGGEFSSINQLNRVMQSKRQPGSAIKPLLYTAAMESGKFTPATALMDAPIVYLDNEGMEWVPENYEGDYEGLVRLREALNKSINVISIKIAETLGIEYVMNYMSKLLKIEGSEKKERIPRNFSIALGSFEVTPFELARAYAIIANGGRDVLPYSIKYVKDRKGNILENQEADTIKLLNEKAQVIQPATAQIMISMLRSVVSSGTGISASIGKPAAGKTGTTNNWKDAWFVGFTSRHTTCIWTGYDKMGLSLGIGQTGGVVAAPVWGAYMREALANEPYLEFPVYAGLVEREVCAASGMLPSAYCGRIITEVFREDTVPVDECNMCGEVQFDEKAHKKAPKENIAKDQKERILENMTEKKEDDSVLKDIGSDLLD